VTVDGSIVAKTNVGNAPKREGFLTHELESVASARHRPSQKSLLDTALLSYRSRVSTPSAPGKRGNQRSGVLGLDLSGLPTNQELANSSQGKSCPSITPILSKDSAQLSLPTALCYPNR
jgi:hypothetical protein